MTTAQDRSSLSSSAEDAELLRRIRSADPVAFESLYDLYGSVAYGVALRITLDEALAQDVVQDAFIAVWRHAADYDPGRGSLKTWLLAIVHHSAVDELRKRRSVQSLPDEHDEPPAALTLPDVWGQVSSRLDASHVRDAFARLPEAQREVLLLAYYQGLTSEAIAEKTHAPLGTVKSRMRLGLQRLRRALIAEVER